MQKALSKRRNSYIIRVLLHGTESGGECMEKKRLWMHGIFLDTPEAGTVRVRRGWALAEQGVFRGIFDEPDDSGEMLDYGQALILPGMTDLHLHAPQHAYAGTAMDLTLMDWLEQYTFPEESRYGDPEYARRSYLRLADKLVRCPSTRFVMFGSIHTDATLMLMRILESTGLVCDVGKVGMDRLSPDNYREDTESGIRETERFLRSAQGMDGIRPMVTPRFTPTVSDAYMSALGRLAEAWHTGVQSHLSENLEEIRLVSELCPGTEFYAQSYDRAGLFGGTCPTVMAHCIHCGEAEMALLKKRGVVIAHCPTSNSNVVAGMAPAARYLREGFRIGLGSDIAGGHTLDMFEVMTCAIQVSKLRWRCVDSSWKPLTAADVLYMATRGGGYFENAGLFAEGFEFDAVVLDDAALDPDAAPEVRMEKYMYLGRGKLRAKFVRGKQVLDGDRVIPDIHA